MSTVTHSLEALCRVPARAAVRYTARLQPSPSPLPAQVPAAPRTTVLSTPSSYSRIRCQTPTPCRRAIRPFSVSGALGKKKDRGGKGGSGDAGGSSGAASSSSSNSKAGADDPFDFSPLDSGISDAVARLKDDLSKLRAGGRFNPEAIETLRVHLAKGSKETVKLGELAQVVPKGGRMITLLAGEEEHIKPITSAIVASDLSLTPTPDAHNKLQLNVPIPPPTKESRDQTVQAAKVAMEKAANAVRNARGAVHKRLQDMKKKKLARPDDLRKADEQMEKVAQKGQKEVKDVFEAARKVLEQA